MKLKQTPPPCATEANAWRFLARIANAVPDFAMSATYLVAWCDPLRLDVAYLAGLVVLMLLEFINIHSGAFMCHVAIGNKPGSEAPGTIGRLGKTGSILALGIFYTLFVGAFSFIFKAWWPVAAFWFLTLNRLLILLPARASNEEAKELVQRGWAAGIVFYIGATFISMAAPAWGITAGVRHAMHLPGGGLWIERPQTVLAAGFLYFGCTAVSELFDHRWLLRGKARGCRGPTE